MIQDSPLTPLSVCVFVYSVKAGKEGKAVMQGNADPVAAVNLMPGLLNAPQEEDTFASSHQSPLSV